MVAVVGIVSEAGALVRGVFLVGGDIVGVAKGGCGKGALADGAEGAVACGGAMVSYLRSWRKGIRCCCRVREFVELPRGCRLRLKLWCGDWCGWGCWYLWGCWKYGSEE